MSASTSSLAVLRGPADDTGRSTQAWRLAFSDEGKTFALSKGFTGNMLQLVEWLSKNYPHKFRSDPIPSWEKQVARLRANKNPHIALSNYQSFVTSTADVREALEESAAAAEREIDAAIDRAREIGSNRFGAMPTDTGIPVYPDRPTKASSTE